MAIEVVSMGPMSVFRFTSTKFGKSPRGLPPYLETNGWPIPRSFTSRNRCSTLKAVVPPPYALARAGRRGEGNQTYTYPTQPSSTVRSPNLTCRAKPSPPALAYPDPDISNGIPDNPSSSKHHYTRITHTSQLLEDRKRRCPCICARRVDDKTLAGRNNVESLGTR